MKRKLIILAFVALLLIAATGPQLQRYDSGWVWIDGPGTLRLEHGLGVQPFNVQAFAALMVESEQSEDWGVYVPYYEYDMHIAAITGYHITIHNDEESEYFIRVIVEP